MPKTVPQGRAPADTREAAVSATEAAILGLLTSGEKSGYELSKAIERSVAFFWSPATSAIYAVLPRLVAAGLATSRKVAQERRPDKQVYRITKRGREALRKWIELGGYEPDPPKNKFLLKVFFGAETRPEVVIDLVEGRRRDAAENLDRLREIERDLRAADRRGTSDHFRYLTLTWGIEYHRAVIRWPDATLRELRAPTR